MTATASFDRTYRQRLDSLEIANHVRTARSRMKTAFRQGHADPAAIAADPPEWAGSMRVVKFLEAAPGVGPVKARKMLRAGGMSESKTLAGLSARQRDVLVSMLKGRAR